MASQITLTPQVARPVSDRNYGREEYIDDCVNRILKGEEVLITFGGIFTSDSLPPILREKYSAYFPGFEKALEEIVRIVKARLEYPATLREREYIGGSQSDMSGEISVDGMYLRIKNRF